MPRSFSRVLFAAALLALSMAASAALPQPGLWSFDGEANGKPGRGIQIDRQNDNRIIVSYFGYRADGSSMFLQAGGHIGEDGKTFSAELNEYKNGRAVGGAARDGELAKLLGTVQMEFDTSSSGSVTLPGEEKRAISRISFSDHRNRLNNQFYLSLVKLDQVGSQTIQRPVKLKSVGNSLEFQIPSFTYDNYRCSFGGDLTASGDGFRSEGYYNCDDELVAVVPPSPTPRNYRLEDLKVDSQGFLTGTLYVNISMGLSYGAQMKLFGICTVEDVILGVPGQSEKCSAEQLK